MHLNSILCYQFRHTWQKVLRTVVCYTKTSSPIFITGSEDLYNFRLLLAPIPGNRGKFQQGVQRFTVLISILKLHYLGQANSSEWFSQSSTVRKMRFRTSNSGSCTTSHPSCLPSREGGCLVRIWSSIEWHPYLSLCQSESLYYTYITKECSNQAAKHYDIQNMRTPMNPYRTTRWRLICNSGWNIENPCIVLVKYICVLCDPNCLQWLSCYTQLS